LSSRSLSDFLAHSNVIDTRITDPFENLLGRANHAAMQYFTAARIHVTRFLHHAVTAFIADIINLNGLNSAFDFRHGRTPLNG
jgi:hypothetical protein